MQPQAAFDKGMSATVGFEACAARVFDFQWWKYRCKDVQGVFMAAL
jgi:hypothetical protein